MQVNALQSKAASRLASAPFGESLKAAAFAFADPQISTVVVINARGVATGILTKSDIVRHLVGGGSMDTVVEALMTRRILGCALEDDLRSTCGVMMHRGVQSAPILDKQGLPLGILEMRDALVVLLEQEEREDQLLLDYIQGVGYR